MNKIKDLGHIDYGTGKHQSNNVIFPIVCPCLSATEYKNPIKVIVIEFTDDEQD